MSRRLQSGVAAISIALALAVLFVLMSPTSRESGISLAVQLLAYALGLLLAKHKGIAATDRAFAHFIHDANVLVLLQLIYRVYLSYLPAGARDPVLYSVLEVLVIALTFGYAFLRLHISESLAYLIVALLFLWPPISLAVLGPVGTATAALLNINLLFPAFHSTQRRRLFAAIVALFVFPACWNAFFGQDPAESLIHIQKIISFAFIFLVASSATLSRDGHRVAIGAVGLQTSLFAAWLIVASRVDDAQNFFAGVNLNTAAIAFEAMIFLLLYTTLAFTGRASRVLFASGMLICIPAFVLMQSFTGYVAVAGSIVLVGFAFLLLRWRIPSWTRIALLSTATIVAIALGMWMLTQVFTGENVITRTVFWDLAWHGATENAQTLITGTGVFDEHSLFRHSGADLSQFPEIVPGQNDFLLRMHPHNDPIAFLYGSGLIGIVAYACVIVAFCHVLLRKRSSWAYLAIGAAGFTQLLHGIGDVVLVQYINGAATILCISLLLRFGEGPETDDHVGTETNTEHSETRRNVAVIAFGVVYACIIVAMLYHGYKTTRIYSSLLSVVTQQTIDNERSIEQSRELERVTVDLEQLNRLVFWSDNAHARAGEMRMLLAAGQDDSDSGRHHALALEHFCSALSMNQRPRYYVNALRVFEMMPAAARPLTVCGMEPGELRTLAEERDPYDLVRFESWEIPPELLGIDPD